MSKDIRKRTIELGSRCDLSRCGCWKCRVIPFVVTSLVAIEEAPERYRKLLGAGHGLNYPVIQSLANNYWGCDEL